MNATRFWSKIARTPDTDACWPWKGCLRNGYGAIIVGSRRDGSRRTDYAHREAYRQLVGPIPEGLTIDHLCRRRECANPWHMEVVTIRVNTLRGMSPLAQNARKKLCIRGHDAWVQRTRRPPGRECRECVRQADRMRNRLPHRKELRNAGKRRRRQAA